MKKTEEKKFFSERIYKWTDNNKIKIRLSIFAIYIILVIAFAIITIININGGMQASLHLLNDYPEQQYQQLEQELRDIIIDNEGIYPEELSNDSIKYYISYKEQYNSEGEYTITLRDEVSITGTIGKDLKKKDLMIEREYKTESEYRKSQYIQLIAGIILIPIFFLLIIYLILQLLYILILIIELLVKWFRKISKK